MRHEFVRAQSLLLMIFAIGPDGAERVEAQPYAYLANQFSDTVSVIDTHVTPGSVVATFSTGSSDGEPLRLGPRPGTAEIWLSVHQQKAIKVIDTSTNQLGATVATLPGQASDVKFDPCGRWAYALSHAPHPSSPSSPGKVHVVSGSSEFNQDVGRYPYNIATSPDCTRLYVANGGREGDLLAGNVSVFQVNGNGTLIFLRNLAVNTAGPDRDVALAMSPDGQRL